MTLGKKLSSYRKLTGMTQQQLGEHLNLSAQAISKWENDLAEPDLATLRTLSDLYKVSIDELLDLNSSPMPDVRVADADANASTDASTDTQGERIKMPIGYCKNCGIAVEDENLGERVPVILCKKCVYDRKRKIEEEKARCEREEKEKKEAAIRVKRVKREYLRERRKKSLIWAAVVAGAWLLISIFALTSNYSSNMLLGTIVTPIFLFTFVASMFYECAVRELVERMGPAAIRWPGLIFTFDLDGFMWLIGMKLLFAVLGFIIGVVGSLLSLALAIIISPFVFVYVMIRLHHDIENAQSSELVFDMENDIKNKYKTR